MFELAASGGPESFGVLSVRPTVPADLLSTFLLQGHSRCHSYSTFRKEEGDNTRAHGDRKERAHRARPQPFCCIRAEPPGLLLVQPRHLQTPVPATLSPRVTPCHPVPPSCPQGLLTPHPHPNAAPQLQHRPSHPEHEHQAHPRASSRAFRRRTSGQGHPSCSPIKPI